MKLKQRYHVRELHVTFKPQRKPADTISLQQINGAADVADAFRFLTAHPKETFVALLLDAKSNVLGYETISIGIEDASLVKPTCAFRAAVLLGAIRVVFVHNHPSGDPKPSPEDHAVYRRACDAGEILGIEVLDFIVLGRDAYTSFTELGAHKLRQLVHA